MKFPKVFPEIKVGKFLLRNVTDSDVEFYFQCLTDLETIENTSYDVKEPSEIKQWFSEYIEEFSQKKRISWVIENTETGEGIGEISFYKVDIENEKGELGYFLNKNSWGKGIMSSLLEKVINYIFQELKARSIGSVVLKENLASRRVLEKNGFKEIKVLENYKKCRGVNKDFIFCEKLANN